MSSNTIPAPPAEYKCPTCHKNFTRNSSLNEHLPSHSKVYKFQCSICGAKFLRLNGQRRHERTQHVDKKFTCNGCGTTFRRKDHLLSHQRSRTGRNCVSSAIAKVASIPDSRATDVKSFGLRQRIHNPLLPGHSSEPKTSSSTSTLDGEGVVTIQGGQYKPIQRYWSFTDQSMYRFLEEEDTRALDREYRQNNRLCNICFQIFLTDASLALHLTEHIVRWASDQFRCPLCPMKFGFGTSLSSHLNTSSRICGFVVNVWAEGGSEELEWGCRNSLDQGETVHDHLVNCDTCIGSYTEIERQLAVLVFKQLTNIWAETPSIVELLDTFFTLNKDSSWMKDDGNKALVRLHKYIQEDSTWELVWLEHEKNVQRFGSWIQKVLRLCSN